MRWRGLGPALLTATLVAGCSAASPGPSPPRTSPQPSSPGTATAATSVTPATGAAAGGPSGAASGPVTLAFAGDVHFAERLTPLLSHPGTALSALRPYLGTPDLAMVNLETAITSRGAPAPKDFHFRAPPAALGALVSAGIDVATLANNHAVDYGAVGLADTLAAQRKSPIPLVGIGADAARAYAPAYLTERGTRIAVIGATQVPDWTLATWSATEGKPGIASAATPARVVAAVKAAKRRADVVVVYLHWGTDYTTCPNALQQRTARALAAAGADVVVGSHAHRVQGAGWLGRTYVDYGLGNFVWWRKNGPADAVSGVLTVTLGADHHVRSARWLPMVIGNDGLPRPPSASVSARMSKDWQRARACTGLAAAPPA